MKKILSFLTIMILIITVNIYSQAVTGKLVDENGIGLPEIFLQLYISSHVFETTSLSDGHFIFNNVNNVENEGALPTGYFITNNFPNPFNPKTRIGITLPERGNVKLEVFNLLGQRVGEVFEQVFSAGTNYVDIELDGLSNGPYISRINIDNKYTVVKKMMLIYGSPHLTTSGSPINTPLNKSNNTYLETNIDSLVATSSIIGRKTFTNLPSIISDTLNLGNLTIERYCPGMPTVLYEGKTYHTVQIGNQCWLKENLDVGVMILGSQEQTNNGVIEKYCYDDDPNNCITYGGLYQWYEAMQYLTTEGAQGICPPGWHLPTLAEFQALAAAVNNDGNALKREDQGSGAGQGTNTSGFSALMAGFRHFTWHNFLELGGYTFFWSSKLNTYYAHYLGLISNNSYIDLTAYFLDHGFSVRCIKD